MRAAILAFCLSGFLAGCEVHRGEAPAEVSPEPTIVSTFATRPSPDVIGKAIAALRQEQKILDLMYDPDAAVKWTIGVKDDGSKRFGYAGFVCTRLFELGAKEDNMVVRVVDIFRFRANGGDARDASLGGIDCNTDLQWDP